MAVESFFPAGNQGLLKEAESFFLHQLMLHPNCEAIIQFGSSLEEKLPKDVDFMVVSDDPALDAAEDWVPWNHTGDFVVQDFIPDFFFRIDPSFDPATIDSVRPPGSANFDVELWEGVPTRECMIYTKQANVGKYRRLSPRSAILYIPD
jgi:hypothetical protein